MRNEISTKKLKSFCVLICAFNESEHIVDVVKGALAQNPSKVIVVDDGSDDATAVLAEQSGAFVIRNDRNSGKGAALRIGFKAASASLPCKRNLAKDI